MKKSKTIGEMLEEKELSFPEKEALAQEHDEILMTAIKDSQGPFLVVCRELAFMRNNKLRLWSFIKNPNSNGDNRGCFANWREYALFRLGPMCQASMYEHVNSAMLTIGDQALTEEEVALLGPKKCSLISQLPPERWREAAEHAKTARVPDLKNYIDTHLGIEPEVKEATKRLEFIDLPQLVIDLIAEVEKYGIYMKVIRDNDRTWSLRAKLWYGIFYHFKEQFAAELLEARQYFESKEENGGNQNQEGRFDEQQTSDQDGGALHEIPQGIVVESEGSLHNVSSSDVS